MEKPKKRPFIYRNRIRDYSFLWIWRICFIFITNAEHTKRFIEIWKAKRSVALIIGKIGFGVGHSFGLS